MHAERNACRDGSRGRRGLDVDEDDRPVRFDAGGFRGFSIAAEEALAFTLQPRYRLLIEGASTQEDYLDADTDMVTGATEAIEAQVVPDVLEGAALGTLTSSPESVATIDAGGRLTRVSDGQVMVRRQLDGFERWGTFTVGTRTNATARRFNSWLPGTLAGHIAAQMAPMLARPENLDAFAAANDTAGAYVRNTSIWCAEVDRTGVSVACERPDGLWSRVPHATMIGSDVALSINHFDFHPQPGQRVRFVGADNVTREYQVAAAYKHAPTDIVVLRFASAPHSSIARYRLAGAAIWDRLPQPQLGRLPLIHPNQDRKVFAMSASGFYFNGTYAGGERAVRGGFSPAASHAPNWPYRGDSGTPLFLLIDGEPVLIMCIGSYVFKAWGLGQCIATIQAGIAEVGSAGSVELADSALIQSFPAIVSPHSTT